MTPFSKPEQQPQRPIATPMKRQLKVRDTARAYEALVDATMVQSSTIMTTATGHNSSSVAAQTVQTDARFRVRDLRNVFERMSGHVVPAEATLTVHPFEPVAPRKPLRFDVYGWVMDAHHRDGDDANEDADADEDAQSNEGEDDQEDGAVEDTDGAHVDGEEEEIFDDARGEADAADDDGSRVQDSVDLECGQCESRSGVHMAGADTTGDLSVVATMSKIDLKATEFEFESDFESKFEPEPESATKIAAEAKTATKDATPATVGVGEAEPVATLTWIWAWIRAIFAAIVCPACHLGMFAMQAFALIVRMVISAAMWVLAMVWRTVTDELQRKREAGKVRVIRESQHGANSDGDGKDASSMKDTNTTNADDTEATDDTDDTETATETEEEHGTESESESESEMKTEMDEEELATPPTLTLDGEHKDATVTDLVDPRLLQSLTLAFAVVPVVAVPVPVAVAVAVASDTAPTAFDEASAVAEAEPETEPETEPAREEAVVAMLAPPLSDQHAALESMLDSTDTVDRHSLAAASARARAGVSATVVDAPTSAPTTVTATVATTVTVAATATAVDMPTMGEGSYEVAPVPDAVSAAAARATLGSASALESTSASDSESASASALESASASDTESNSVAGDSLRWSPRSTASSASATAADAEEAEEAVEEEQEGDDGTVAPTAPTPTPATILPSTPVAPRTTVTGRSTAAAAAAIERTGRVVRRRAAPRAPVKSKYMEYKTDSEAYQRTVAGAAAKRLAVEAAARERRSWK